MKPCNLTKVNYSICTIIFDWLQVSPGDQGVYSRTWHQQQTVVCDQLQTSGNSHYSTLEQDKVGFFSHNQKLHIRVITKK